MRTEFYDSRYDIALYQLFKSANGQEDARRAEYR